MLPVSDEDLEYAIAFAIQKSKRLIPEKPRRRTYDTPDDGWERALARRIVAHFKLAQWSVTRPPRKWHSTHPQVPARPPERD